MIPEERQTMTEDMDSTPKLAPPYVPTNDPRPDLANDSAIWGKLLLSAHKHCNERDSECLFWVLVGLRSMGCGLTKGVVGWRIVQGENKDYAIDRERYLVPHKELLVKLLSDL